MKKILLLFLLQAGLFHALFALQPDYSINLMWINSALATDQQYVVPARDKNELLRKLKHVVSWAHLHPKNEVNLWYDSHQVPISAVSHTQEELPLKRITLQDVRSIPEVEKHSSIFGSDMPVYFRADLLRILATMHVLHREPSCHARFVYADLDVVPLTRGDLFDATTNKLLDKYGFVVGGGECSYYENGFHIMDKNIMAIRDGCSLADLIKLHIIDVSIANAQEASLGTLTDQYHKKKKLSEQVFSSYALFFGVLEKKGFLPYDDLHRRIAVPIKKVTYPPLNFSYAHDVDEWYESAQRKVDLRSWGDS